MQNLPEPVRDLLAAILEAIDIPSPATVGDTEPHDRLLNTRAMHAKIALRSALEDEPLMDIEWTTAYLRERLAEHPVTGYVTVDQAHAALDAGKSWSEAVTLPAGAPEPLYGGDVDQFISDAYDSLADSDPDDEQPVAEPCAPVGPGCGAPATARIEGYSPRGGIAQGSLDLAVYACPDHATRARTEWLGGLNPHTMPCVVDARCGHSFDYTTLGGGQ